MPSTPVQSAVCRHSDDGVHRNSRSSWVQLAITPSAVWPSSAKTLWAHSPLRLSVLWQALGMSVSLILDDKEEQSAVGHGFKKAGPSRERSES